MSDFDSDTGQHNAHKYSATNPHPLHGKDPNIMNELGHTHYPKMLHKFDDKGAITHDKVVLRLSNHKGIEYDSLQHPSLSQHSKVVENEEEEEAANAEGYFYTHHEAKAAKKQWATPKPVKSEKNGEIGK